jgi:hypothetical protein
MTLFQYYNDTLDIKKREMRNGEFSISRMTRYIIYCRYDMYRKQGFKVTMSVDSVCEDFNITRDCMFKIVRIMESEFL